MNDIDVVNLFLARTHIPVPRHILLKTPGESDFRSIQSLDGSQPVGPLEIPAFEHEHIIEDAQNQRTVLWLRNPGQSYVVMVFPAGTSLDDDAVQIIHHLLLTVSLEKKVDEPRDRFQSIIASIVELSATVDFDILIDKILEKTISIVMADAGMLWVYDSGINKLVCKAYKGNTTELALSLQLERGEGLIGKTFLRGTPKLYNSYEEALPDIEDFSNDNKKKVQRIFGESQMDSVFLMPIFVNQRIECIMIVYRFKGNPPFSSSDIEILKIFAELIGMTLTNARSLITLQGQLNNLEKSNQVYSKLTSLSVNNSGIASIVKELKRVLGIPVRVINLMTHEQYPRGVAFERKLLVRLMQANIKNNDPFLIEAENKPEKYRVHPILVENSCLGYLIVTAREDESQIETMILEIGRTVIALELSKAQSMLDILFKRTAQNFLELINLNNPLELSKKSSEMGLDLNANYGIAEFAMSKDINELQTGFIYRLIANIKTELAGAQKIVFISQEKITVLIATPAESGINLAQEKISAIIAQTQNDENILLCAGMGSFYPGARNINKAYREAESALMYQLSRHHRGLLKYCEMGVNQLFINLTSEEAGAFLSRVFTPLRENSKQSEYLEKTLIAYVEANGSMIQTAKKLYIHTNTLYQRLKKIEDCLQISFKNPDELLQIQLACYLRNNYPDIYNSL